MIKGKLYEVSAPKLATTPEAFYASLHVLLRSLVGRIVFGQPWISLEVCGYRGKVRFFIWMMDHQRLVRAMLESAGIELTEVEDDPLKREYDGHEACGLFGLARSTFLPIRTDFKEEPLEGLMALLASTEGRQFIYVSLLVKPKPSSWQNRAHKKAHRLIYPQRGGMTHELVFDVPVTMKRTQRAEIRERASLMNEKARHPGFDCSFRVMARASNKKAATTLLKHVAAALRIYEGANGLRLRRHLLDHAFHAAVHHRRWNLARTFVLNTKELAALWHIPAESRIYEHLRVPNLAPPHQLSKGGRVIGVSTHGEHASVPLSATDARRHMHVLGSTGQGKTTLLVNLARQDIEAGRGVCVLDPKGDLVQLLLLYMPRERINDVVLIEPDSRTSIGLNPMQGSGEIDFRADNLLAIFRKLYAENWGIRTQDILNNSIRTLMRQPDTTICDLPLLLSDAAYRKAITAKLDDPWLLEFWKWFNGMSEAQRHEITAPVANKLRDFLSEKMRRILGQRHSTFDLDHVLNHKGILLCNLSSGMWGEGTASVFGSMIFAMLWQKIRERAKMPEDKRRDFMLYVDEFQQFLTVAQSFEEVLAQARSFRFCLTLANQSMLQLPKEIQQAVTANARTRLVFQCGADDARMLSREFAPLDADNLMNLPRYVAATKLSLNGEQTPSFTLSTLPLSETTDPSIGDDTRAASRAHYARPVEDIDKELRETFKLMRVTERKERKMHKGDEDVGIQAK